MRKLLFLLLLLPCFVNAQTIMQWNAPNPGVNSLDTIRYTYPGKAGGFSWLWNAEKIRGYVNAHSIVYTSSRGINKNGNNFRLGGTIDSTVTIQGDLSNRFNIFQYDNLSSPGAIAGLATLNSAGLTQASLLSVNLSTGIQNSIGVDQSQVQLAGGTYHNSISISDALGISIRDDSPSPKGIQYTGNYDATLTGNSLVPKRLLDSTAKAKADSVVLAHPGTGGTVTSITPGYGFTSSTPITTSGTLTNDTTKLLTVLNTFPKNDTRYYTKTLADGRYQPLEDQRLSTTNSPSFVKQLIIGTAGGGYEDLISQSVSPASLTGHLRLYSDSLNRLAWKNSSYRRTIQVPYPTDFTIRMPYRATQTTLVDSTDAKSLYTYTAGTGINIASNVVKSDTTINQTVLNFFPKADTRYYTKTAADAKYLPLAGGTMSGTINSQSLIPISNNVYTSGSAANNYSSVNAINLTSNAALSITAGSGTAVTFFVGSSPLARIWANGNTLIQKTGTFTDIGYSLGISNSGTNGYLKAADLSVNASGQVINATTPAQYDNSTKVPTTAYVDRVSIDNVLSKTANYTILTTDWAVGKTNVLRLGADATSGNITITFPAASSLTGYVIYVTKKDASVNTVTESGPLGISILATQLQSSNWYSDGTSWYPQ